MALSGSLNFISASVTGSANIKVDFVGLNTLIVDPLTASSNDLGYPHSMASTVYYNSLVEAQAGPEPNQLNSLLLHRNGPYQHPMWRQYRGGDHPVARKFRLNNTMSIDLADPSPIKRLERRSAKEWLKYDAGPPGSSYHDHMKVDATAANANLTRYYEPSIISKYKPFIYSTTVGELRRPAKVRVTLANQMEYFKNQDLNNALKMGSLDPSTGSIEGFTRNNQKYYQILHMAKDLGGSNFIYSERMFPKSINAYRSFKFNKPNYEETTGLGTNGFDRENHRSFWRVTQESSNVYDTAADGTSRLRTVATALNSQGIQQHIFFSAPAGPNTEYSASLQILSSSTTYSPPWNHTNYFIHNGIVANQISVLTGGVDVSGNPVLQPSGAFVQLEAYQPYMIPLLSMWPLDVRSDIYSSPEYLTSSIAGKGLQIGLTPHSSTSSFVSMSQAAKAVTGAWFQRSAGELTYSTKPTIYFFRTLPDTRGIDGYRHVTASLQYNRHTFPYNTPFYATHKVRGRDPMYDSYGEFKDSDNLKHTGRDFSIIPEFKMSDNIDYYLEDIISAKNDHIYGIDEISDFNQAPTRRKIVSQAPIQFNHLTHKLNFLRLDGADTTSSSNLESLSDASPTETNYIYDDLVGTTQSDLVDPAHSYASSATSVAFYEKYSHSDTIVNFAHLMDQKNRGFSKDTNTIPSKITFTCHGVKKLLPYNGFYPVLRTVQIGNAFKNAFSPYIENVNATQPGGQTSNDAQLAAVQTVLEPFMAPGVLYNSIKSGIAVDYPIHYRDDKNETGYAPLYYTPLDFVSASAGGPRVPGTAGNVQDNFSASFNYGGGYMMGSSRCFPAILNNVPTKRVDFENLYDLETLNRFSDGEFIGTSDFVDLDRFVTSAVNYAALEDLGANFQASQDRGACHLPEAPRAVFSTPPGDINTKEAFIYESSINNFLCETMEFFLKDQGATGLKLPVICSAPQSGKVTIDRSIDYYMEVTLRMGQKQILSEGPRKAGIGTNGGYGVFEKTSTMRGYIYGPPIETAHHAGSVTRLGGVVSSNHISGSTYSTASVDTSSYSEYLAANLQDPAYHAYTPPYFYGESSLILPHKAISDATSSAEVEVSVLGHSSLFGSFTKERYVSGSALDSLCLYVPALDSFSSGSGVRMKIESSIDIKNDPVSVQGSSGPEYKMWYFAPKWVCPVLDFSSSIAAIENKVYDHNGNAQDTLYSVVTNPYHDYTTGRGLWGGYGTDPYDSQAMKKANGTVGEKGIFFEVGDSFKDRYNVNYTSTTTNSDFQAVDAFFNESMMPYTISTLNRTDSLLDKLGFQKQSFNIGQFAPGNVLSEAVVIIPYFDRPINIEIKPPGAQDYVGNQNIYGHDGVNLQYNHIREFATNIPGDEIYTTREIIPGKHFLPIHRILFDNILSVILADEHLDKNDPEIIKMIGMETPESIEAAKQHDIGQMIKTIMGEDTTFSKGFQLPPEFDFINNPAVGPYQMMVIPMKELINKQDLIDIYQGIMPDASINLDKIINSVSVSPAGSEFETSAHSWFPAGVTDDVTGVLSAIGIGNMLSPVPVLAQQQDAEVTGWIVKSTIPDWLKTSKDFYKNLKFMVFKVKQRGRKDYSAYRNEQISKALKKKIISSNISDPRIEAPSRFSRTLFDRKVKEAYGANWPYDYFSLIETVKIDVSIEVPD